MHYTLGLSCKSSFPLNRLWTAFMFSSSAINIHPRAGPFVISAGAILGICAGLLWTAQGSLMLAYPTEDQKGRFIGIFWGIFNMGAVVGASVSLGQNFHSTVRMQFFGNRLPSLTMNCCTSG
jgi:MFS family permease